MPLACDLFPLGMPDRMRVDSPGRLACRLVLSLFLAMPLTAATADSPLLPKTTPATAISVYDLSQDLASRNPAAKEAYLAMLAIQGLVNRDSANKIYFVHTPVEWHWDSPSAQLWLDDGLVPVPATTPSLDRSKAFPVLRYLLRNHITSIKGKVMIPDGNAARAYDGAFAAAFTACGMLDAIPVSSAIDRIIVGEGLELRQLEDVRPLNGNTAAFDWAYERFLKPETCRKFIGSSCVHGYNHQPLQDFPNMLDYWLASRAFIYCLNPKEAQEKDRLAKLLKPENFPLATPIIGSFGGEGADIEAAEDLGYPTDISFMPNVSVTSSFIVDPKTISRPSPRVPATIDPNGAYVGFYVTDGDSWLFSGAYHQNNWSRSPSRGRYPIGWSMNIQMLDVFPTLLAWRATHDYDGKYELIANSWHLGRAGGDGLGPFIQRYRHYMDQTQGLFRSINLTHWFKNYKRQQMEEIAAGAGFLQYLDGYGSSVGHRVSWSMGKGVGKEVIITGMTGPTQGGASAKSIVDSVTNNLKDAKDGMPVFMIVLIGDGNPDCVAYVDQAVARLEAAPPRGRKLYWQRPSDVGATWQRSVR